MRDTVLGEPRCQLDQTGGGGGEAARLAIDAAAVGDAHTSDDARLVHIEAGAARVENLHRVLPFCVSPAQAPRSGTLKSALQSRRSAPGAVRGARKRLGSNSKTGSRHHDEADLRASDRARIP